MKYFWQIAFAAALIYILFMSVCNRETTVNPDYVKENEKLVLKSKRDSVQRIIDSIAFVIEKGIAARKHDSLKNVFNKTEIKLYQQQGTINRLVTQLRSAKELPFDSSFVYVAPEYVENCDSLGDAAIKQGELLKKVQRENEQVYDIMNYEIFIRDSVIDAEAGKYNELRNDFNAQTHFFQLALKDGKKRIKGYAGISALGNDINPFGGGEVSFSLQMKKQQVYEIGSGFINKDWYVRVGTKFLIKFR